MRRGWHHIIVRCGPNTTKDFMEKSEPGVVLGDERHLLRRHRADLRRHRGRRGRHVRLRDDPDHLRAKKEVRQIWDQVRDKWFTKGITGKELYDYAIEAAAGYGWKLNMDLSGHRLSDFPHSAHYDGPLAEVDVPAQPQPVGARDRHRPPRAEVRRVLRGPPARGPVVPRLSTGRDPTARHPFETKTRSRR